MIQSMKSLYQKERSKEIARVKKNFGSVELLEKMFLLLPLPIQNHLKLCGYHADNLMFNADIFWKDSFLKMKPEAKWTPLSTLQHNSVDPFSRIAYMKFKTMPVTGRDIYTDGKGEMHGKLFNFFTIIYGAGAEINQSALLTLMAEFLFVSGYLFHQDIQWETLDKQSVRAILRHEGMKVEGVFYFDEEGLFRLFTTNDRFYQAGKNKYQQIPFSAKVIDYKQQDNLMIPCQIQATWHFKDFDYTYFKGTIDRIQSNVIV